MTSFSIHMRDWLADHFRFFQYAKPVRSPKRDHSFWREFARESVRLGATTLALILYLWRYRNTPGIKVFGLFIATALAWCGTHMVCLIF